ncbi:GDSL esterase/lipase At5g45910 [Elaeis guineensis]|uniref:GDSL esterase/lipase At5g45910 n=1 Tax=Elaeis guineensis var. tenera TaxID=51953 RepID=A0A6I9QV06_ELAGV|nr:GDSL esterase/lipase At5g45910 [Elaeis guineensis]
MKISVLTLLFFSCLQISYSFPARYNAIFSFGNSLADTGNFLITGAQPFPGIGRLPYGITFFGRPTGRCSDGRLVIDFIAEAFGLPLLPPSLASGQDFRQGANFAVTACTALDVAFWEQRGLAGIFWTNDSLGVQLQWFEQLKPSLCTTLKECKDYFGKSLFVVGEIGGNDYHFPLLANRTLEEVRTYVPEVIEKISKTTEILINQGAVDLVLPGSPPSGCFGLLLTLLPSPNKEDYDPRTGCLKKLNALSRYHNKLLRRTVKNLRSKYPEVRIVYADFYEPVIQFVRSPERFGFSNGALISCCGGGGPYNFNPRARCAEPGATVCKDPSKSIFWDGIHLTEAAYRYIATGWLQGPYANPPIMSPRLPN